MISSELRWGIARLAVCAGVILLLALMRSPSSAQTVFTWTDNGGTVHFSDSPPPPGQKYEQRDAAPLEPPVRQQPPVNAGSDAGTTGVAPAAEQSTGGAAKGPARVILTSKDAAPRGPETRHVIGAVKNVGGASAERVGVTMHIVDNNGGECGREEMEVVPGTLDVGETGNFDGTIDSPCFADGDTIDAEVHWD